MSDENVLFELTALISHNGNGNEEILDFSVGDVIQVRCSTTLCVVGFLFCFVLFFRLVDFNTFGLNLNKGREKGIGKLLQRRTWQEAWYFPYMQGTNSVCVALISRTGNANYELPNGVVVDVFDVFDGRSSTSGARTLDESRFEFERLPTLTRKAMGAIIDSCISRRSSAVRHLCAVLWFKFTCRARASPLRQCEPTSIVTGVVSIK